MVFSKNGGYMLRYGFHMSISGGIENSAVNAGRAGYKALQIFTASSRSWKQKIQDINNVIQFKKYIKKYDLLPVAHIPYLCNLASSNSDVLEKSIVMLSNNIQNCNSLGIPYLVLHLGSHLGKGSNIGIGNITESINKVVDSLGNLTILLENTSGYKNSIGSKFDEIGKVIDKIKTKNIGICFDTCHAFAAGYDIREETLVDELVNEIDSNIGIDKMKLIHLNDSKFDLNSTKDRHWHIGKGYIGIKGFVCLFQNDAFRNNNFIMETPENEEGNNEYNLKMFKSIMNKIDLDID